METTIEIIDDRKTVGAVQEAKTEVLPNVANDDMVVNWAQGKRIEILTEYLPRAKEDPVIAALTLQGIGQVADTAIKRINAKGGGNAIDPVATAAIAKQVVQMQNTQPPREGSIPVPPERRLSDKPIPNSMLTNTDHNESARDFLARTTDLSIIDDD